MGAARSFAVLISSWCCTHWNGPSYAGAANGGIYRMSNGPVVVVQGYRVDSGVDE